MRMDYCHNSRYPRGTLKGYIVTDTPAYSKKDSKEAATCEVADWLIKHEFIPG